MNNRKCAMTDGQKDRSGNRKDRNARNSGIELLKIISILLIVNSHVLQSLTDKNAYLWSLDYMFNLSQATTDLQLFTVSMIKYYGIVGNMLFFICSAWFLLDSKRSNKRKMLQILMDIWVISMGIFIFVMLQSKEKLSVFMLIRQFFPTIFANNWYMTCYLIFCLLYPFLNLILANITQKTLLRICMLLSAMYIVINYFLMGIFGEGSGYFFYSFLILWVTYYFIVAYMKYYLLPAADSLKNNLLILAVGVIGNFVILCGTNFLGLRFAYFQDGLMRWNVDYNPFHLLIAIALFNIGRNAHFHSKLINHIAGLSYLIYVIHENILLRNIYRPRMWLYIYEHFGYEHMILWMLVLTAIVFGFALCCAFLYELTVQRVVVRICNYSYPRLAKKWNQFEDRLMGVR